MEVVQNHIGLSILELEEEHGSLRAAAKAIDIDQAYLFRLKYGEKINPSDEVLEKLKLGKVTTYYRIR